jgi:hypothetical protein
MVGHHEAAHLELNYVTSYGLLLRAAGTGVLGLSAPGATPGTLTGSGFTISDYN